MAVISKIRSYSGLLIAVIGIALAAFVLGDFLGYGPGSRQSFDIGKIGKHTISYQEFERRVNERIENWRVETNSQNVDAATAFQLRQQVWNDMTREIILDQEFERLGLEVTREELYDMIHGPEPHMLITRSFTNPADGSFNAQDVVNFFRNFDQLDASVKMQWTNMERFMKQERLENKYHSLIQGAYHVPAAIAAKDYRDRNTSADFRFVFKPFQEVADSLVSVTDRDLRRVYDENKERFRQPASRDLAYVAFDVRATEEDRQALQQELLDLQEEFAQAEEMAPFINSMSDSRFDPRFYGRGELSPEIDSLMFAAEVGALHGPYLDQNAYVIAKLVDAQFRPDSMSASHILLAYAGAMGAQPDITRSPARAQELADSLLEVVKRNPARFAELATSFSDDGSVEFNQGNLDWFADGDMVTAFNEAVINTNVGGFTTAESDFGFHVIQVTGKSPATKKIQVAFLTRNIEPSSRTYQSVYAQASTFASGLRQNKDFAAVAEEQEVPVRVAEFVREMDYSIPGVENPRGILQWAFLEETKKGSFSRVFELDNRFVIATVTEVREDGIPTLDQIKDEVTAMAIQEKKFEMLAGQARQAGDNLESIASAWQREVTEATDIRFNSLSLPNAGNEPRVIGTVFTLQENSLSAPVKGNNGVFVVQLQQLNAAEAPEDLSSNKRMLQANVVNRVVSEVFEAVKENARLEDNRNMFY